MDPKDSDKTSPQKSQRVSQNIQPPEGAESVMCPLDPTDSEDRHVQSDTVEDSGRTFGDTKILKMKDLPVKFNEPPKLPITLSPTQNIEQFDTQDIVTQTQTDLTVNDDSPAALVTDERSPPGKKKVVLTP